MAENALTPGHLVPMRDPVRGAFTMPVDRPAVFESVGLAWHDLVVAQAMGQGDGRLVSGSVP